MPVLPDHLETGAQEGPYNKVFYSYSQVSELEAVGSLSMNLTTVIQLPLDQHTLCLSIVRHSVKLY